MCRVFNSKTFLKFVIAWLVSKKQNTLMPQLCLHTLTQTRLLTNQYYLMCYFINCFDWTSLVKLKLLMMLSLMQPANQHNKACLCYYKLFKFHNKPILCICLHVIHYHTTCQCTISCKGLKTATITKYQWTKKIAICFKIISQSIK